jgi:hypothetical protein
MNKSYYFDKTKTVYMLTQERPDVVSGDLVTDRLVCSVEHADLGEGWSDWEGTDEEFDANVGEEIEFDDLPDNLKESM